jgi:hypothetical protein
MIFGLVGALALLIASIGVYGLEAYEVLAARANWASAWRSAQRPVISGGSSCGTD